MTSLARTFRATLLFAAIVIAGCDDAGTQLPFVGPPGRRADDRGFDVTIAPRCAPELVEAVMTGDVAAVEALATGVPVTCTATPSEPWFDPLLLDLAILRDEPRIVATLLSHGASPNVRWFSHGDRLPLQDAIWCRGYGTNRSCDPRPMVRLLIAFGADVNARWCHFESRGSRDGYVGCTSPKGATALHDAARFGLAEVVQLLLYAGADPNATEYGDAVPIEVASDARSFDLLAGAMFPGDPAPHRRVARFLSADGPVKLSGKENDRSAPPLVMALQRADLYRPGRTYARVRTLLDDGADPNARGPGDTAWTALGLALAWFQTSSVEALLAAGADPNARWCMEPQATRYDSAPRPSGCSRARGITPLMWVASSQQMIDLLLTHGADPALRDWCGRTAADYRALGRYEPVQTITQRPCGAAPEPDEQDRGFMRVPSGPSS